MTDYNLEFNPPELFQPNPYRSSDHDPVIVGLDIGKGPPDGVPGPPDGVPGRGRQG